MSRTTRKVSFNSCALRNPKTFNEKRQIDSIITDEDTMDYPISKMNRILSADLFHPTGMMKFVPLTMKPIMTPKIEAKPRIIFLGQWSKTHLITSGKTLEFL